MRLSRVALLLFVALAACALATAHAEWSEHDGSIDVEMVEVTDYMSVPPDAANAGVAASEAGEDSRHLPTAKQLEVDRNVCWPSYSDVGTYGWTKGTCRGKLAVGASCSFGCRRGYKLVGNPITCANTAKGPRQRGKQHCVRVCQPLKATQLVAPAQLGTCANEVAVGSSCRIKCPANMVRSGPAYTCDRDYKTKEVKLTGSEHCVPRRQGPSDAITSTSSTSAAVGRAARAPHASGRAAVRAAAAASSAAPAAAATAAAPKRGKKKPRFAALEAHMDATPNTVPSLPGIKVQNSCINSASLSTSWQNYVGRNNFAFDRYLKPLEQTLLSKAGLGIACGDQAASDIVAGKTVYLQMDAKKGIVTQPIATDACAKLPLPNNPKSQYPLVAATLNDASVCAVRQSVPGPSNTTFVTWGVYVVGGFISNAMPAPLSAIKAGGIAKSDNRQLVSRDFGAQTYPPDNFTPLSCRAVKGECQGHFWAQMNLDFDFTSILPANLRGLLSAVSGNLGVSLTGANIFIDADPDQDNAKDTTESAFAMTDNFGTTSWMSTALQQQSGKDFSLMMNGRLAVRMVIAPLGPLFDLQISIQSSLLVQSYTLDKDDSGLSRNGVYLPFVVGAGATIGAKVMSIVQWIRSTFFVLPAVSNAQAVNYNTPTLNNAFWLNSRGAFFQATVNGVGLRIGLSTEEDSVFMICIIENGTKCEPVNLLQIIKVGAQMVINGVKQIGQAICQAAMMIQSAALTFIQEIGQAFAQVIDAAGRLIGRITASDFKNGVTSNIQKLPAAAVPPRFKQLGRIAPSALTAEAFEELKEESAAFRSFLQHEDATTIEEVSYVEMDADAVNEPLTKEDVTMLLEKERAKMVNSRTHEPIKVHEWDAEQAATLMELQESMMEFDE